MKKYCHLERRTYVQRSLLLMLLLIFFLGGEGYCEFLILTLCHAYTLCRQHIRFTICARTMLFGSESPRSAIDLVLVS